MSVLADQLRAALTTAVFDQLQAGERLRVCSKVVADLRALVDRVEGLGEPAVASPLVVGSSASSSPRAGDAVSASDDGAEAVAGVNVAEDAAPVNPPVELEAFQTNRYDYELVARQIADATAAGGDPVVVLQDAYQLSRRGACWLLRESARRSGAPRVKKSRKSAAVPVEDREPVASPVNSEASADGGAPFDSGVTDNEHGDPVGPHLACSVDGCGWWASIHSTGAMHDLTVHALQAHSRAPSKAERTPRRPVVA